MDVDIASSTVDTCLSCSTEIDNCLNCHYDVGVLKCLNCNRGYLVAADGLSCTLCSSMIPDCVSCIDIDKCSQCQPGYFI